MEDIGIEESNQDSNTNNNQDPLVRTSISTYYRPSFIFDFIKQYIHSITYLLQLNMLMRLQEAANYSGNQSQDSDNASMDSNLTHDSSMGNEL